MRAAVIAEGTISCAERPDPTPSDDELLVRVVAAGLNGADIGQRAGRYPPPDGFTDPSVPGLEIAGYVIARGARVTRFETGTAVMGLVPGGGQAELATIHERHALAVPEGVDLVYAGGFPEVYCTAYDALFTQAGLAAGERVLVTGAAGGVGIAGVQLAVTAGASVVASVRNPEHRAALTKFGALALAPEEALEAGPFDVILELVGAPNIPGDLGALATLGRITVIGTGAGSLAELELGLLMRKRARIHGSTLRARSLEEKAAVARAIERHVLPLLADGRLTVPVEETFALGKVARAYERFVAGKKLGKIIVTP